MACPQFMYPPGAQLPPPQVVPSTHAAPGVGPPTHDLARSNPCITSSQQSPSPFTSQVASGQPGGLGSQFVASTVTLQ
jgi:hypothetical protein